MHSGCPSGARKYGLFLAKLAGGLVLLGWLVSQLDWRASLAIFPTLELKAVLFALLLFPVGIWLCVVKWRMLLVAQGVSFDGTVLWRCYWIGFFANNFLPSSVGGDISRLALLRRPGVTAQIAASIAVERLSGLAVLLLWSVLSLAVFGTQLGNLWFRAALLVGSLLALLLIAMIFTFSTEVSMWCHRFGKRRTGSFSRFIAMVAAFSGAIGNFRGQWRVLLKTFAITIPFYATPWLFQVFLFRACRLEVQMADVFWVAPLVNLAGLLPLTPNALGITEGVYVYLYAQLGIAPEGVLTVALLGRLLTFAASLVGGCYLLGHRLRFKSNVAR